jgi:cytochrome c-type biogenesis protein CcmE
MKARQQRMLFVGAVAIAMVVAGALAFRAFNENLLYFYSPTQVANGEAPVEKTFRLGGLVLDGSIQRESGTMTYRFIVTDLENELPAEYTGVPPDLFAEGQGVVAHGVMSDGRFIASRVLAKHDENYMAPEVAKALAESEARAAE